MKGQGFWPVALAGAAATLIGIGLARFAFVPLFPALVVAGWVSGEGAAALGAVTLAAYLAGALTGQALARRVGVPRALDAGALLVAASFLACAWPAGFPWLLFWRAMAGLAGGWLMALAGPAVQAAVAPGRQGLAAGLVVAGVAAGITLGALGMPWLLAAGPGPAWLGLAAMALLVWALARPRWPRVAPPAAGIAAGWAAPLTAYALSAVGMVAPMVYLSDLAVRGHGLVLAAGALSWAVFGLGGLAGTLLGGPAADRLGGRRAARLWLAAQVLGLACLLAPGGVLLWPGAFLSGFAGIGVTAVLLALLRAGYGQRAGPLWARATAAYGVAQAAAGFALAGLFAAAGEAHAAVFLPALIASLLALAAAGRS
ncbi:MAG: YbfB/YjiJ family MFS transporter [Rhodovarius sp.]|nr:YbfB/YjiJ family MFS transporter [Rhodovarius sp.]MCX7931390.1 YbfB/YjiJ family MFS transporter [Rhodovarius sp.]MDW8315481.1 YbfB/YjiJ family MFS transporter [Rhodovarius sp.]